MGAARQLYVKRSDLVILNEAKDNTKIHMQNGESFTVFRGELIATDLEGNQMVIPQSQKDNYIPVQKMSDLEAQMAQGYAEMAAINLEMSEAFNQAENEAETVTTDLITGAYND
ncbi:hypothetical protein [Bacillus atrophaeus]|uniref:hypothetical protein n=1 Tax=Bacillus atrophaeus TaxID=1452 RepID=UPI0007797A14|nr:hypothetical protein [Bacillus atrophaeus]MCY7948584.1 hypothetical protein [Bacillus atrophaeus]MCY8098347.1 hypothetical protein [Bacillus atrophaeus]MCY8837582.1 hypothetical protein [Bacillus atrophaeus]MCY8922163.1 hypothetical protein [Bacillus atrophaeus]MCY9161096.1 hypothetical protein [Bacillus atrophaeus]